MTKWYRWTAIVAVAVVAAGVGFQIFQRSQPGPEIESADSAAEVETGLTLTDVTLEQPDENGDLLWRVKAQSVTYSIDKQLAQLNAPEGEFFQNGEVIYRVKADRGEVEQNGETLFLEGNIVANGVKNQLTLRGNELEWRPKEDLLLVRDRISGSHPQLNASANEARVYNQDSRVELEGGVTAKTKAAPWVEFKAEAMIWYIDEQRIETDQPLQAEQFQSQEFRTVTERVAGKSGIVRLDEKTVKLAEAVQIDLPQRPLQVNTDSALWNLDQGSVILDQPVQLQQAQVTVTADAARMDLNQQTVYLTRNVRANRQNGSLLTADRLSWQFESQQVEAEGNVRFRQRDPLVDVSGPRAVGNLAQDTVTVSGGVVTEFVPENLPVP
ncbi:LPS export ABC transporter periplasmic protein LptC [Romeria aff. gracilis LEGE 07310]|uniref:LPS export ABC transporter periplasmic protein LptC n=1 Tax=Vasconcelosia minhoensis LEGE 07310 TaxID=915328 RepID=A0A8J7DMG1_9CYAN|nr:LPS export ABC transporter periplasmic protein LptC [Romeria gracilis]MBE9076595.1 LPS export ABC transporter periplasmic protein LptC [Romeria aff. gracilis LEGE 07310]